MRDLLHTRLLKRLLTLFFVATTALLMAGCVPGKTISAHQGCNDRVATHKKGACHACIRRGPRFVYKPHHEPGRRCMKR